MPIDDSRWFYVGGCAVVFVSAMAHAGWVLECQAGLAWSTLRWHVFQWLPLLSAFIAATIIGAALEARRRFDSLRFYALGGYHNVYGWLGRIATPLLCAVVGYIIGLEVLK
jgi:hypothetical protein